MHAPLPHNVDWLEQITKPFVSNNRSKVSSINFSDFDGNYILYVIKFEIFTKISAKHFCDQIKLIVA